MKEYLWYETVNGKDDLMQGDFIKECPIVIPPSEISDEVEVRIINYDVVTMSQSCDLIQRKLDLVLVCPIWPLSEFEKRSDFFKSRKGKEALRQGNVHGYHLLNKCEIDGFETEYLVVDFRSVYSVPFDFLVELSQKRGTRLRLLPPYREHLSQAFARFFMRVGLPVDIPPFK
ncbi:MAG: hypothetical protein SCAL_000728 [Candidatus Syntrophoarchaeum caldarius]|uniref:Uncharacterized protein n=1 Tax=Candidatus Syntropharchaeum caldarium TaxID=1838285 RepID=A0A1F2PA12_9EURY|nr:MAG: hypothetical protein SCAL_000728 [Candidatus Syntrophoarchaeum caldarius]